MSNHRPGNATRAALMLALLSAPLAACDGDGTDPIRVIEPPAQVRISPDSAVLFIGQSQTLTATAYDAEGAELNGRTVVWSSSDGGMVSVTEDGAVTGRAVGSATITATIGGVSASVPVRARENPVKGTSYENFKEVGLQPARIPLPATEHWGYHERARAYGDFFGDGELGMFTATVDYDKNAAAEAATRAVYRFWRRAGDGYVEDNGILVAEIATCVHSRKALVADFNLDGRPDIFITCQGFDAAPLQGETNQVLLSQPDGSYELREASPDVGYWLSATAADLNGDAYPDVLAVTGYESAVFINDGTGSFTTASTDPGLGDWDYNLVPNSYFDFVASSSFSVTVELVDVNEDGRPDLLLGGHEWIEGWGFDSRPTAVWLNPGDYDFSDVTPVIIPAVENEGVVLDFTVTGTGPTRTIWISRTSGGDGTVYESAVLQRFNWHDRTSTVVYDERPAHWVPWIIAYERAGVLYVGSDDLRTPMEVPVN